MPKDTRIRNVALKIAIVQSGQTQRALARRLDIDETRFSRIVSGEVEAYADERRAIARALGKGVRELFSADHERISA